MVRFRSRKVAHTETCIQESTVLNILPKSNCARGVNDIFRQVFLGTRYSRSRRWRRRSQSVASGPGMPVRFAEGRVFERFGNLSQYAFKYINLIRRSSLRLYHKGVPHDSQAG